MLLLMLMQVTLVTTVIQGQTIFPQTSKAKLAEKYNLSIQQQNRFKWEIPEIGN